MRFWECLHDCCARWLEVAAQEVNENFMVNGNPSKRFFFCLDGSLVLQFVDFNKPISCISPASRLSVTCETREKKSFFNRPYQSGTATESNWDIPSRRSKSATSQPIIHWSGNHFAASHQNLGLINAMIRWWWSKGLSPLSVFPKSLPSILNHNSSNAFLIIFFSRECPAYDGGCRSSSTS